MVRTSQIPQVCNSLSLGFYSVKKIKDNSKVTNVIGPEGIPDLLNDIKNGEVLEAKKTIYTSKDRLLDLCNRIKILNEPLFHAIEDLPDWSEKSGPDFNYDGYPEAAQLAAMTLEVAKEIIDALQENFELVDTDGYYKMVKNKDQEKK